MTNYISYHCSSSSFSLTITASTLFTFLWEIFIYHLPNLEANGLNTFPGVVGFGAGLDAELPEASVDALVGEVGVVGF